MLSKLNLLISWRTLRKNKARSIITMIGILISVILLTTIIILATSYKSSMVATTVAKKGDWHYYRQSDYQTMIFNIDDELGECEKFTLINEVGYSKIIDVVNDEKPYIHFSTIKTSDYSMLPLQLIEGKYPLAKGEIIIPKNYADNYGKNIGDFVDYNIGQRLSLSGEELHQNASFLGLQNENISYEFHEFYEIVGISETVTFIENNFSPGYSVLTFGENEGYTQAYVKLKNPNDCKKGFDEFNSLVFNKDLLDILGINNGENTGNTINVIIVLLGIIIMLNCFIIINNAFMLSINEKAKDYALYNSLGMTNGQIISTIIVESLLLSFLVIPIAILLSIGIVEIFTKGFMQILSSISYSEIVFKINLDVPLLIIIGLLCTVMVIISSVIPFLLNKSKLGIAGIKGNHIIKNSKKLKVNKKRKNVFMQIISSNIKRYRSKYVFSIISIVISITLLLNVGSFCKYSVDQLYSENYEAYDIYCNSNNMNISKSVNEIYGALSKIKGIEKSWWVSSDFIGSQKIDKNGLSNEAIEVFDREQVDELDINYLIIDDETYNSIFSNIFIKNKLSENCTLAIACFNSQTTNQIANIYDKENIHLTFEESSNIKVKSLELQLIRDDYPVIFENYYIQGGINIFIPFNQWSKYLKEEPQSIKFYFNSKNPTKLYDEMIEMQTQNVWDISIVNYTETLEKEVSTVKIIEAFANVFLLIVTCISLLNIINTISQTILMRKREFAIFTSIGMQDKTLRKFVLAENYFMYLFSLVVSTIFSLILSAIFKFAFKAPSYYFPWTIYLFLNCLYIFTILAITLITLKKVSTMNTIEIIKDETT